MGERARDAMFRFDTVKLLLGCVNLPRNYRGNHAPSGNTFVMLFRLCEFFPQKYVMRDHTTNEQSFSTFKNIVAEHQIKNLPNLKGTSLTLSLPKKQRSLKPESDAPPIYLAVARRVISAAGSEGGGARV